MDLNTLLTSKYGIGFAMFLGRILPPPVGYFVAENLPKFVSLLKENPNVRAVRANQWVIGGKKNDTHSLDQAVKDVFRHSGRCIYDMYHAFRDPNRMAAKVTFSPRALQLVETSKTHNQGMVLVGPHLSNFDLCLQALAHQGLKTLILSYPQPTSGYQWQNQLRTVEGMEAAPLSISVLRQATDRIRSGGMVLTGIERPISSQKYPVKFFGEPALLPVTHIQLALRTRTPVVVIGTHMDPDGSYIIDASEDIQMQPDSDHQKEITLNAERVLARLEEMICEYPRQWLMFYPVWPQTLDRMP